MKTITVCNGRVLETTETDRCENCKEYVLLASHAALVEAVHKFRQAFVIAVGDKSPFAKYALKGIDIALENQ
jgi:hypothetical protein